MPKKKENPHYKYDMFLDTVEFLPDATFAIDRDKRVIAWNKAMEEMTGVPKEDMIGKTDQSYAQNIYGEKRPLLIDLVLLKDKEQDAFYEFFERKGDVLFAESYIPSIYNGRGAFLWGKAAPLYDKKGKVVGAVETMRDITGHKKTHIALQESEKKYKQLVEEINDIIYMLDSEGTVTYISPLVQSVSGYSPAQVIGRHFTDFIHQDDKQRLMKSLKNLLSGQPWEPGKEFRVITMSGEIKWLQISSKPIYDEDRIVGLRGVMRDITEKKNAEKELRLSEERYRDLVDLSPDAICLTDGKGIFVFVNDAGLNLIAAKSPSDIIGKSLFEFLHSDYHIAGEKLLKKMVEKRLGFPLTETKLVRVDEKVIDVEMAATPMEYNGEIWVQAVVRDVTERKLRDKEIKESEERYRILTEHVGDGVALSHESKLLFVNQSFAAVFGFSSPLELVGRQLIDLVGDGQKEEFSKLMEELKSGIRSQYFFQVQCLGVDAREFWVEGYLNIIQWKGSPAILTNLRDITERKLQEQLEQEERDRLRKENIRLISSIKDRFRLGPIIGKSPAMQEVYELIHRAAASSANVIIYGESGTGKELVARAIHDTSDRHDKEFVPVNCGAIPENLLESEFFGHKKGAFTGAHVDKHGYLDLADGGSLFLDEIGELGLNIQVKLLRAIEGNGYTPLGSSKVKKADVRIIAATNRDLMDQVRKGLMREDLFYRIHIIPIKLPALRDRREDIHLLIEHFLKLYGYDKNSSVFSGKVMDALYHYDWPGNVRELQNVLHRYVSLKTLDFMPSISVSLDDELDQYGRQIVLGDSNLNSAIQNYEKQLIAKTLEHNKWHRIKAASALGISRNTLFRKMKEYELI